MFLEDRQTAVFSFVDSILFRARIAEEATFFCKRRNLSAIIASTLSIKAKVYVYCII